MIALIEYGKLDQKVCCGFKSVGEQMKLTKLIKDLTKEVKAGSSTASTSDDRRAKLTINEMGQLSGTERKIYLYK